MVSSQNRALIANAFGDYCLWGGFPELVEMEERFKPQVLQEYFNVMLYRDLCGTSLYQGICRFSNIFSSG